METTDTFHPVLVILGFIDAVLQGVGGYRNDGLHFQLAGFLVVQALGGEFGVDVVKTPVEIHKVAVILFRIFPFDLGPDVVVFAAPDAFEAADL